MRKATITLIALLISTNTCFAFKYNEQDEVECVDHYTVRGLKALYDGEGNCLCYVPRTAEDDKRDAEALAAWEQMEASQEVAEEIQ